PWFEEPSVRELVSALAGSAVDSQQRTAWRLLASAGGKAPEPRCTESLKRALPGTALAGLPLLLEAMAARPAPELNEALKEFASDEKRPLSLRLKALNASTKPGAPLAAEVCRMLLR